MCCGSGSKRKTTLQRSASHSELRGRPQRETPSAAGLGALSIGSTLRPRPPYQPPSSSAGLADAAGAAAAGFAGSALAAGAAGLSLSQAASKKQTANPNITRFMGASEHGAARRPRQNRTGKQRPCHRRSQGNSFHRPTLRHRDPGGCAFEAQVQRPSYSRAATCRRQKTPK